MWRTYLQKYIINKTDKKTKTEKTFKIKQHLYHVEYNYYKYEITKVVRIYVTLTSHLKIKLLLFIYYYTML